MSGSNDACIVTCAISGQVTSKSHHPAIPYTPDEYAAEARRAYDSGAAMVHIHARAKDGSPSWSVDDYEAIRHAILDECPDIVINFSTGAVGVSVEERTRFLRELRPEVGALNMGSMNYAKWSPERKEFDFNLVFENSFDDIIAFLTAMSDSSILPEMECFDLGHIESIEPLIDLGLLASPMQFSLVLGVLGGAQAEPTNLAYMASRVPPGSNWGVIGVGKEQWKMITTGAALGGNVRTGLEDNFYLPNGDRASGNGALIEQAVAIVESCGRHPATPDEARSILELPSPRRGR